MSELSFRIEEGPQNIEIYGEGFEVARWTAKDGWQLRIDGDLIPLEKIIRRLNEVQAQLARISSDNR